ncbi:MAG: methionine--tRNA ligase, partial [Desulfurococcales archaeon]|nr:methionine--tRNA ligase [Desulfurococcales archaeon]
NKTEPWRKERPTYELYNSIEALRYGTSMLWPLMPVTAERIAGTFGFNIVEFGNLKFGSTEKFIVTEAPILFRKKN